MNHEDCYQLLQGYDGKTKIVLPRIQYIIGTEAMDCEVSSDHLKRCKSIGIPPNLCSNVKCKGWAEYIIVLMSSHVHLFGYLVESDDGIINGTIIIICGWSYD